MSIQLVNKDGVLVECSTAEDLVDFFASNKNANTEVKKEIARVVNLSNRAEESLLLGGTKELVLAVISGFFKGVGSVADAGDDALILGKIYGGVFTSTDAVLNAELVSKMTTNSLSFKYIGMDISVVDAQGMVVTSIPSRDASGTIITTQVAVGVNAEGKPVYEDKPVMDPVDFTVYNKLALTHMANIIAAYEGLSVNAVKHEIEVSILDNIYTPKDYVDQYLNSADAVLFNKALVHPNSDSAAKLASIKTNPLYPQSKKLELIAAIVNPAQFSASGDLMKFFLDRNGQISETDKAVLQKATFLKLVNLSIEAFNTSLSDDIKMSADALTSLKNIFLPAL